MKHRRMMAFCPERTKTMDYVVFQIAEFPSLCSLCLCALCVQRRPRGHALHGIDLCCSEAAFDTEDTEAQRTQRNFRYFSSGLSKPFLRYLRTCRISGRTGVDGIRVSASGRKLHLIPSPVHACRAARSALEQPS